MGKALGVFLQVLHFLELEAVEAAISSVSVVVAPVMVVKLLVNWGGKRDPSERQR